MQLSVKQDSKWIYVIGLLLSFVWSFHAYFTQSYAINSDGILYLRVAEAYHSAGFHAAMTLYHWPFYGLLIGLVKPILGLSYLHTAYVINITLQSLIVLGFIKILRQLGASIVVQFIGLLLILIVPALAGYRSYIIRGFGYWAFGLLALSSLISYAHSGKLRYIISWYAFAISASLFRVEGFVLFALMPFALCFSTTDVLKKRILKLIKILLPSAVVLLFFSLSYHFFYKESFQHFGRLDNIFVQIRYGLDLFLTHLHKKIYFIHTHVLINSSMTGAVIFILSGIVAFYIYLFLQGFTIPFCILLFIYMATKRIRIERPAWSLVYGFIFINVFISFVYLAQQYFLSTRYLVPLYIGCLLFLPFVIEELYQKTRQGKSRILFYFILIALLIMTFSSLVSTGYSQKYMWQASQWLEKNVSAESKVYANDNQLAYFSDIKARNYNWKNKINKKLYYPTDWKKYNFLAIKIHRHNQKIIPKIERNLHQQPIKIFKNKAGAQVLIFKVKK